MLMNGGRREAIKGSSWPLAAESALGAGSRAAVPLFRTKPRPSAREEAAFRQVAARTAHGRGSRGPFPGAAYPFSTSFLVCFFAQLVSQKWKIHIALWKKVGCDRWSLWPELILGWERNKDAPSLHFLNHVERSWKEKHLNERPNQPMKVSECEKQYQSLGSFFFFPVADLRTNSIFLAGLWGTLSQWTDTERPDWVLCTK